MMEYLHRAFFHKDSIVYVEREEYSSSYNTLYTCLFIQRDIEGYQIYNNYFGKVNIRFWIPEEAVPIDTTIVMKIKKLLQYHSVACNTIIKNAKRVDKSRQFVITEYGPLVLVGLNTITISDREVTVAPGLEDYFYYKSVPAIGSRCILRKDYNRILRKSKELIINIDESIWKELPT